jgi:hypothetical protein
MPVRVDPTMKTIINWLRIFFDKDLKLIRKLKRDCKNVLKQIKSCSKNVSKYKAEDDPKVKWHIAQLKHDANCEMDDIRKKYQKEIDLLRGAK